MLECVCTLFFSTLFPFLSRLSIEFFILRR